MGKFFQSALPIAGIATAAVWLAWQRYQSAPRPGLGTSWEDTLYWMIGGAYLCLLLGGLGLRRAYVLFRKKPVRLLSAVPVALFAFLCPFIICLVLQVLTNLGEPGDLWQPATLLLALEIWLPGLQGASLALILLLGERFSIKNWALFETGPSIWVSILSGLGLWLTAVYAYQLGLLAAPGYHPTEPIVSPSRLFLSVLSVLLLPFLEGLYFRGRLLPELQSYFGSMKGFILSAAMAAVLTMQPFLWIPAFLAGTGFNFLASRPGGLRSSIYAHAFFNLLALLVVPGIIF